jgi:hypothetical protein
MIQYLIAGLVGGAVALAQKPKKMERGGRLDEEDIKDRLYDMGVDYEDLMENAGLDLDAIQDQYLGFVYDSDTNTWGMGYAKGGRVSTYDYVVGGNPNKPFDVLGRKDGMVMYHTSRESIKDSTDKAEELLENGYDEVLIAQP